MNSIAERGILFDGRYKLLRTLSSDGGTADVWLALDTNTIDEIYNDDDDTIGTVVKRIKLYNELISNVI